MAGGDDAGAADADVIPENALYISPTGSDQSAGTADAPFRSFSIALSKLEPGGTLVALPGEYNASSGTGTMNIDCRAGSEACDGAPCPVGVAGAPIVIRALQERTAKLVAEAGMASANILLLSCQQYRIEGFTVIGRDDAAAPWENISIEGSSDVVLRRSLFSRSNRMVNGHVVNIESSSDVLIEENEIYDFHRVGIAGYQSSRVTVRRNYVNARSYPDVAGGYVSSDPNSGDIAMTCSHSADCLFENNISEGDTMDGTRLRSSIAAPDAIPRAGDGARYFANVFMNNAQFGMFVTSSCAPAEACPDEFVISSPVLKENLVINAPSHGIFIRGATDVLVDHNSLIDSDIRIDLSAENINLAASATVTNTLATPSLEYGLVLLQQDSWLIDYSDSFGFPPGFETDGDTSGLGPNNMQVDPQLGACLHRIPTSSPLSGAGSDASDIGATIVKRYVNGIQTAEGLWDATSGAFPCGAVIPGVNDTGNVCSSVHTRLGVGSLCPIE